MKATDKDEKSHYNTLTYSIQSNDPGKGDWTYIFPFKTFIYKIPT